MGNQPSSTDNFMKNIRSELIKSGIPEIPYELCGGGGIQISLTNCGNITIGITPNDYNDLKIAAILLKKNNDPYERKDLGYDHDHGTPPVFPDINALIVEIKRLRKEFKYIY